ncbi:Cof-type HAD-IIB family hydrolase [Domibacillus robiginosus]|uniref:Cof-type HAD-IIB family hydrolase n=1 Tax=Domibacillus robiginosus TaxID=1071054 RepID=UPI00067E0847|nr:Cof-type HAD-IIB family hydrolase [Domibacillus robiginosus]
MAYSLIAIDLDGTLLNEEKEIDDRSIRAIRAFEEQGGQVVICSGRTPLATRWIAETIGLQTPIISLNGAVLHDEKGTLLDQKTFSHTGLQQFVSFCEEEHICVHLYEGNDLIVAEKNRWNEIWVDQNILPLAQTGGIVERRNMYLEECRVRVTPDIKSWIENHPAISKMAVFSENGDFRAIEQKIKAALPDVEAASSSNYANLEISPRGAAKGVALKKLAARLNVPIAETAAIGDNFNDISMFQCAGMSIAMGNAPELVKAASHHVTASNNENGIEEAITFLMK